MDKFESLKMQCTKYGFEVVDQQWVDATGAVQSVLLRPVDPEQLVYAAATVYNDRAFRRRERLRATREAAKFA